jgi:hypothetical protein
MYFGFANEWQVVWIAFMVWTSLKVFEHPIYF